MARFDIYPSGGEDPNTPYLLDVQSDLLVGLETRVVIPLRRRDSFPAVHLPGNFTPIFEIDGTPCILETPKLAAVPLRQLKPPVGSLKDRQAEIAAAMDFLFQGF